MAAYGWLVLGVLCAWSGGDLFVRGVVGLSLALRVSAGLVAATVAAFATSSPELSVGVNAALAGDPALSLGNLLGSNVTVVALVLAIPIAVSGIVARCSGAGRDFPGALLTPVLVGILGADGRLSRLDGLVLVAAFLAWLSLTVRDARRERGAAAPVVVAQWGLAFLLCAVGFSLLTAAGRFIVLGARGVALSWGLSEFAVGATVVAIGTTVPELTTTILAARRGHPCVGEGTVLGSVIFNGLFIAGVVALIRPFAVAPRELAPAIGFGAAAVALAWPGWGGRIGRGRGALLLALYVLYVLAILHR